MSSTLIPAKGNVGEVVAVVAKERQVLPLEPLHSVKRHIFWNKAAFDFNISTLHERAQSNKSLKREYG